MSQDKKLLKEIFEKLKENFEIITATLGFFVMCIDYIIKLIFSKQREIEYNIPSKYFFYFNYNQILLISLFIVILVITVLQSIYNKEKNQDNDSKIQGRKLQNFGCQVTVAYLLLIFNVYQLNLIMSIQ